MLETLHCVKKLLEEKKAEMEGSAHKDIYQYSILVVTVLLDCVINEIERQEAMQNAGS